MKIELGKYAVENFCDLVAAGLDVAYDFLIQPWVNLVKLIFGEDHI